MLVSACRGKFSSTTSHSSSATYTEHQLYEVNYFFLHKYIYAAYTVKKD
jgi:hypothetical protein